MKITKPGKYELLETRNIRMNYGSITRFPKGKILTISDIDEVYNHIYIEEISDWHNPELPVKLIMTGDLS